MARQNATHKLTDAIVTKLRRTATKMVRDRTIQKGWGTKTAKKLHLSTAAFSNAMTGLSYAHLNTTVPPVRIGNRQPTKGNAGNTKPKAEGTRAKKTHKRTGRPFGFNADIKGDAISRAKLGREIQSYLQRTNMNQTLFARLVNDAATQISRIANSHYGEFSADRLCKMLLRVGYEATLTIKRPSGIKLGDGNAHVAIIIK